MTAPIPSPPAIPFLGHVNTIDSTLPLRSMYLLSQQYGEIIQLTTFGRTRVVITSQSLLNEVSDESRFRKKINGGLAQVRNATGDGLFTAHANEPNWGIAHRLLMPCFGTSSVYNMYDGMMDIISQLVLKWERFGPHENINPAADFTRLTMDAIALCSMSYRLNSFYQPEPHPFATAMTEFLLESGMRARRPGLMQAMMSGTNAKYEADIKTMSELVHEILEDHKTNPPEKSDLIQVMLTGRDKETGHGMSDESIKNNLVTFLIAGHETTSGMLSFITYYLVKNPEAMRKLREEIDEKIGDRPMSVKDINQLPYLLAVMRESLRLAPTAPGRSVAALEDTVVGGKYAIPKDTAVIISIYSVHRDPKVWGEDVNEFRPERMLGDKFDKLPPNAWQPFGFGVRGCIGRAFAWQEVQLAMVTILQRFDLVMRDPSYELELKQTLTIKPNNFYIHAIPRKDRGKLLAVPTLAPVSTTNSGASSTASNGDAALHPLYILYGSNTGNSEGFAQRLASAAFSHGFRSSLTTLDAAMERLPTDGPILIVTASFEGEPADNAKHFVAWLESVKSADAFAKVKYGVFGCGNHDWVKTFQRIPTLIDDKLKEHGAIRLVDRGVGDAGGANFFDSFDQWETKVWEKLEQEFNTTTTKDVGLEIKTVSSGTRAEVLRQRDLAFGTVIESKVLTAPGAPIKLHIELALPEDCTYRSGDYLAVLPVNPERVVHRAISRLGLSIEQEIEVNSAVPTSLPTGKPITIFNLLSGYVELQQPATMRDLDILLGEKNSVPSSAALKDLKANYAEKVFAKRLSVLDILEENKDIDLCLSTFLRMLPSMRIRQYSISSSPLWNPEHVTLTLGVVDAPARSGRAEPFLGVASTYIAGLRAGDKVQMAVRSSSTAFHLPQDPAVPLVLICAGSGLAPMRGFLQERAEQKKAGREVATSLLFFGCRRPNEDFLYGDAELREWAELGVVDIRSAFSRATESSKGCRYVQDRIKHDKDDVIAAFSAGAKFFVCGSNKVASAVKEIIVDFVKERRQVGEADALATFDKIMQGRYATDIFE